MKQCLGENVVVDRASDVGHSLPECVCVCVGGWVRERERERERERGESRKGEREGDTSLLRAWLIFATSLLRLDWRSLRSGLMSLELRQGMKWLSSDCFTSWPPTRTKSAARPNESVCVCVCVWS